MSINKESSVVQLHSICRCRLNQIPCDAFRLHGELQSDAVVSFQGKLGPRHAAFLCDQCLHGNTRIVERQCQFPGNGMVCRVKDHSKASVSDKGVNVQNTVIICGENNGMMKKGLPMSHKDARPILYLACLASLCALYHS